MDEPLWLDQDGQLSVLHADALGSVRFVTDTVQAAVERTAYTSVGVPARTGTGVRHPFAFAGREGDGEIGLYYYRARYYDPEVGRFLSRDPLGLAAGPNLHVYAENSPTNAIDPAGTNPLRGSAAAYYYGLCQVMRPWNTDCFVLHYWFGLGRAVDTDRRMFLRDFTDEPALFVYGKGLLFTSSTCSGIADCATRTCSFDCEINVEVPDEFSDPFGFRERFGRPVEVGIPYDMRAQWIERWSGAAGF